MARKPQTAARRPAAAPRAAAARAAAPPPRARRSAASFPRPGKIDEKSGFRIATSEEIEEAHEKHPRTGSDTHRATARGYAVPDNSNGAGVLIEEGETVPADVPISNDWMVRVKGKDAAVEDAVKEAQQPLKDDPDLTQLDTAALQALATQAGVTSVEGLSDEDLITAINAQRDNTR